MVREKIFSKNLFVLVIIATIALILSTLSYQYYESTSNQIFKVAAENIRSNARIQVHDLSISLANKLDSITNNLRFLSGSPTVQSSEYDRARIIINSAENSTSRLVDFYMWLDMNGKILWISNINQTTYEKYKETYLSYRPYFIFPKDTHKPFYSSTINSNDKVPRLYISYPIINNPSAINSNNSSNSKSGNIQTTRGTVQAFKGVMVAGIRIDTLGDLLKKELSSEFQSVIGLLDYNATILYVSNQPFSGKNVFGKEMQSTLSSILTPDVKNSINNLLKTSLQSNKSSNDLAINGEVNTIAYEPVIIGGKHFLTLYVIAVHTFASNVDSLVDQEQNFSTVIIIAIGGLAISTAFLFLLWNKRLKAVVNSKTAELNTTNNSLIESNKQLAEANKQLKVHDKMQKEFINVAAHELRTPIQPILSLTEVVRSKIKDTEVLELQDVIIRSARRLIRLTEDILDVTRIESQSLKLKMERFNLNDVITDALAGIRTEFNGERNLKLIYQPQDVFVEADKERITQVMSNLLNNAVKFIKESSSGSDYDGGTISITAAEKKENDEKAVVIVSVKDTGTGIDPEILPRLFGKFASKSHQGTGLGLFISKSIVEAHGGKMWAENNNNVEKGATFYFSIPLNR